MVKGNTAVGERWNFTVQAKENFPVTRVLMHFFFFFPVQGEFSVKIQIEFMVMSESMRCRRSSSRVDLLFL